MNGISTGDRLRAFEALDLIGQKSSSAAEGVPRLLDTGNATLDALNRDVAWTIFNYRTDMHTSGKPFASWADKLGSYQSNDDNFTALSRWNLSDPLMKYRSQGAFHSSFAAVNQTNTFVKENVVVLTDGYCASTCAMFAELMREIAGVKFIVMGGSCASSHGSSYW